ncbi:DUF2155 domain-containing protein [Pseudoroseicyclus tamaricis]|uniref:DUF2155 domain-containing protein n=1 Tax=Pseudoroseicyclus tamaricis TaxID=2705421 RepID=A0A6B2JSE3_9RHOB|nr:DUF2155 domain-containing protein [Pseudoroseicyclus tamaricis]NDV00935.1 DUF2155 domain-containing protein [Pseudoroseicyclus tamaricis]
MRAALLLALALVAGPVAAQQVVSQAPGGVVRVLDKITGAVTDLTLRSGETTEYGHLAITLGECRYPSNNPSGDAFEWLVVHYQNGPEPVFRGWMIASAPALNPMDHPRYDVWALSCLTELAPAAEEAPLTE